MISAKAREDYEDLQALGLNPTLEDFDRLNSIALRLTDGPETTGANVPRIGWAGDVPFHEPTVQALFWLVQYAGRVNAGEETHETFWFFALAHARTPHAFDRLTTPEAIEEAVGEWAKSVPVTRKEIARACRYALHGYDDAEVCEPENERQDVRQRTDRERAMESLARFQSKITKAAVVSGATMENLFLETPSRLDELYEAYAVEQGKSITIDEAKLLHDYKLTLAEIRRRLTAEKESTNG